MSDKKLPTNRQLYRDYVQNCRAGNVYWGLTPEEFYRVADGPCAYCGNPPRQRSGYRGTYNGLDRINPKRGYEPANVVACCTECNGLKSNRLTFEEMRVVAQALKAHRGKGDGQRLVPRPEEAPETRDEERESAAPDPG